MCSDYWVIVVFSLMCTDNPPLLPIVVFVLDAIRFYFFFFTFSDQMHKQANNICKSLPSSATSKMPYACLYI